MTDETTLTPQELQVAQENENAVLSLLNDSVEHDLQRQMEDAAKTYSEDDATAAYMLMANRAGYGYEPYNAVLTRQSHTHGYPAPKKNKGARMVWPASNGTYVKPK